MGEKKDEEGGARVAHRGGKTRIGEGTRGGDGKTRG